MKNQQQAQSGPVARQRFFVPPHAPFLEIRTTLDSALPYAEHFHSAFSLGLILQGKTRFSLSGPEYLAEEGDIVLIAQGRAHSCNPVDGPRGYHMLLIDAAWLQERIPDAREPRVPLIRDAALFRRAEAVVEAFLADRDNAPAMLADLLLDLHARDSGTAPDGGPPTFLCPNLNDAEDAPPSVSGLARQAGMCRESYSRAVRRKTGLPPSRYLHCLRLEKARWLLRQGKSITEAALALGYADQSHFHRMFVRFCAVTPGRYRESMSHSYKK